MRVLVKVVRVEPGAAWPNVGDVFEVDDALFVGPQEQGADAARLLKADGCPITPFDEEAS